jgi:hypothetical protein
VELAAGLTPAVGWFPPGMAVALEDALLPGPEDDSHAANAGVMIETAIVTEPASSHRARRPSRLREWRSLLTWPFR